MNVLVGCEKSGRVRDAFIRRGHTAISCDLEPSEVGGPHYQGDIFDILLPGQWDLFICHPPCTRLAVSGAKHMRGELANDIVEALDFFAAMLNAPIEKIALENPVGIASTFIRKPDQYIQPYEHGEPFTKKTGLWLKNLPLIVPTHIVHSSAEVHITPSGKKYQTWYGNAKSTTRSRTFQGIADAFANQWG